MPSSSHNRKQPYALTLKQAANWHCQACGRQCRRQDESLHEFSERTGYEIDMVEAHPRRWILHVTRLSDTHKQGSNQSVQLSVLELPLPPSVIVLCGSCHRTYQNYRRWQHRQQRHRQQQEHIGQLTLNDIRLPLAGLQLSLSEWGTPYEIVNSQPKPRRTRPPKTFRDIS